MLRQYYEAQAQTLPWANLNYNGIEHMIRVTGYGKGPARAGVRGPTVGEKGVASGIVLDDNGQHLGVPNETATSYISRLDRGNARNGSSTKT